MNEFPWDRGLEGAEPDEPDETDEPDEPRCPYCSILVSAVPDGGCEVRQCPYRLEAQRARARLVELWGER